MRWQRAAPLRVGGLAACGIVLVQLVTFQGCVDGTTPDCSDAATHCGPDVDATSDVLEAALPEAAPPTDAPNDTSSTADANGGGDADLDAGDEG
jgi:hypothetical protein